MPAFNDRFPFYMDPETARALLQESIRRRIIRSALKIAARGAK